MMNLAPSPEQSAIGAAADEFLRRLLPISRIRELATSRNGSATDDEIWRQCAQMGWLSLGLEEAYGGLGMGLSGEIMLFRELGRHLVPGPFLSTVLGLRVVAEAGNQQLASAIADGRRLVGLGVGAVAINVRPGDLLLEIDKAGARVFELSSVQPTTGVDPTTDFANITKGALVARIDDADLISRARVLAAAELTGIVEAVCDMSASYAKTRVQFGKPIGSFQAVKHRCADMAISAYASTSQLFFAAVLVDAKRPSAPFHAASAYVVAINAAKTSAGDNVQNHGGIGFTWEHESHLYLKRAFLIEHILGSKRETYSAIMEPASHEFSW